MKIPLPKKLHPQLLGKAALVIEWENLPKHGTVAHYYLTLPLDYYDTRNETKKGIGTGGFHRKFLIGQTTTGGSVESRISATGEVRTPFRDGCHIQWDQLATGLPMFAVCGDKITELKHRNPGQPFQFRTAPEAEPKL